MHASFIRNGLLAGLLSFAAVLFFVTAAAAKIVTRDVEYKDGQTVLQGYLAYDDAVKGQRPGVLVFHEWDGVGPYVKQRAEQLVGLGYVAFCPDIYGKGIRPTDQRDQAKQAGIYRDNRALMRQRAVAGLDEFRRQKVVDPGRIVAIGYCFGGGVALELARSGADIAGVVSFHGNLDTPTPQDARNIRGKILALAGANDPVVPPDQQMAFMNEMRDAHVNWQMNIYGGAVHRFTNPAAGENPSSGYAYNPQADRRSWDEMVLFFNELFGKK